MKRLGLLISLIMIVSLLAACATPTPEVIKEVVTQVVEVEKEVTRVVAGTPIVEKVVETQIVEKEVTKVVEIEKVVTATPPPKEVVLRRARTQDPQGLDPHIRGSVGGGLVPIFALYDQLVKLEGETLDVGPALAESWEIPDPTTYIFHLRKGVKFHDGTEFNAEAVKFNAERVMALGELPGGYWLKSVESVEVLDDYTVQMNLNAPYVAWLATLAGERSGGYMVSPACVEEHKTADDPWATEWLYDHDCGSGPYMLEEYLSEDRIVMTKFPDYWRGWEGKHVDKIIEMIVKEAATRRFLLEKGEVDLADLPTEFVPALQADPNITVDIRPSLMVYTFYLNVNKFPTDDIYVRKALNHAFDYEGNVETIHLGYGDRPVGPMSKSEWPVWEDAPVYEYDLDKARATLEEGGWVDTDGDGIREKDGQDLNLTMLLADFETWRKMALLLQDGVAEMGGNMEIEWVTWPTEFEAITKPPDEKPYNVTGSWAYLTVPDPHERLWQRWHTDTATDGYNAAGYMNPELDVLLDEAIQLVDREERIPLYIEAQKLLFEDMPGIFVIAGDNIAFYRTWVKNFLYNPGLQGLILWYDLYIEDRPPEFD